MKKVRGKALALVLSLALVVSSFSTAFSSAASKTVSASLGGDFTTDFYFVNGGTGNDLIYEDFGKAVSTNATLTNARHQEADSARISAITRKSGDNLVKWYDEDGKGSIDSDTEKIDLALRNATVSGTEVISILYKGTYTDENDKEYTFRASKDVTIRVYNEGEVVIGLQTKNGEGGKGELDSDFAQKTVSHETAYDADGNRITDIDNTDSKDLTALKAGRNANDGISVEWEALNTVYDPDKKASDITADAYYLLKTSSSNIVLDATDNPSKATTVDPEINKPGIAFEKDNNDSYTGKFTVSKLLSDVEAGTITYLYTTDGTAPTVKLGTGESAGKLVDNGVTKVAATDATIPDLVGGEKLNVVGYVVSGTGAEGDPYTATQVTEAVKVTFDNTKEANNVISDADIAKPGLKVTTAYAAADPDSSTEEQKAEVTIGDVATVYYYYSIDGGKTWEKVTDEQKYDSAASYTPGESYDVKAVASTNADAPVFEDDPKTPTNEINVSDTAEGTYTEAIASDDGYVTARVKDKATPTTSLTFTAEPTAYTKAHGEDEGIYSPSTTIKQKSKITKTILVDKNGFDKIGKYKTATYLYNGTLDSDNKQKVNVGGFEVKFKDGVVSALTIDDKANVDTISGVIGGGVTVDGSSSVDTISSGDIEGQITVTDGEVDTIKTDNADVEIDDAKSVVGEVADANDVTIKNGKVGNVSADGNVSIEPDDDEHAVTVGDVTASNVTVETGDSLGVKVGKLKINSEDSVISLSGDNVTVGGVDFNYYGAELKLDGFTGTIPAPENADTAVEGATISTQQADDKVLVHGDADINAVELADESQFTFDGKLNAGSVNGSGKLIVGLGKLNVTSDASSDVRLQISDPFKVGDVAYTSDHDTIDEDSFTNYGFTVTKSEGSSKDTFKIASVEFTGLTIAPATVELAKGQSQTFKASAYAPGTAIPEGYTIHYSFDGDDSFFDYKDNGDGTVTVAAKAVSDFASENKATLTAELQDADGATNDDYDVGEATIIATKTPAKTYKSDTTGYVPLKVGQTYQFKITSLDGKAPTSFSVASNGATIQFAGATGSDYFYKVTGAKEGSYGVYVNGGGDEHRAAILVIKGVNVTTDTTAVTRAPGQTYQFKITAPSQPNFVAVGLKSVLASKSGNNYFYKVTASNVKGGHGIYVNGVRVAIFTVA